MQIKSYRFKLFNNSRKSRRLEDELRIFCQIYNHSIRLIRGYYKLYGKHLNKNKLQKHLTKLGKTSQPQWEVLGYSQGIQEVTDRIYKGYSAFFEHLKNKKSGKKSPPGFKKFRKYKSFTLKQAGWELDETNGKVRIGPNWYKYNNSRKIQGTPKTINIKRDAIGDWFITISCELDSEYRPEKIAPTTGKSAGFDFGLKTFLTASDGEKFEALLCLKRSLKELAALNRELSRKEKGSKNSSKAKKRLAKLHIDIANQRLDGHFKLALNLLRKYDYIFIEDLCLTGMKKLWGRKVSDLGFGNFIKILEFMANEHRKTLSKVDRFFPSSKLCSNKKCGMIKASSELKLRDRVYKCECCGLEIDRDLNAAINIENEGASSLWLDGVRPDFDLASVD
jgi:putative transposase